MNKIAKLYLWLRRKVISDEDLEALYMSKGITCYRPNIELDKTNPPQGGAEIPND